MKKVIYIVSGGVGLLVMVKFGVAIGGMTVIALFIVSFLLVARLNYLDTHNNFTLRIDHVYIFGNNPHTGEEVPLPDALREVSIYCPHKKVIKTVDKVHRWLVKTGNTQYNDTRVAKAARLRVLPYLMGDGHNMGETWEVYCERSVKEALVEMSKQHEAMKKQNPSHYHKFGNHQLGIVVEKSL